MGFRFLLFFYIMLVHYLFYISLDLPVCIYSILSVFFCFWYVLSLLRQFLSSTSIQGFDFLWSFLEVSNFLLLGRSMNVSTFSGKFLLHNSSNFCLRETVSSLLNFHTMCSNSCLVEMLVWSPLLNVIKRWSLKDSWLSFYPPKI